MTSPRRFLTLLVLGVSLAACATTATAARATETLVAVRRPDPRDVHGEVLALLPPGAVSWARVETQRARASRHWGAVTAMLTNEGLMDTVRRFQRELGVDALASSTRLAGAVYERISGPPEAALERIPRAALLVRDGFDANTVRAALARDGLPVREETVGSLAVYTNGRYAVSFLAPDVMIAFHPAIAAAVERQISGEERQSLESDPELGALWERAGVRASALARSAGRDTNSFTIDAGEGASISVPSFQRVVAWVDGDDAITVRSVALAPSNGEASQLVAGLDGLRREYGGRFLVRMMGFGRLLNEGISLSTDGAYVRVAIDAQGNEVQRALQMAGASTLLRGG